MFKLLTASILSFALASTAIASEGKASVFLEGSSDYLYRGQSVTNDKPAVTAGLRVSDLVVDGTFATVQATTLDVGNLDTKGTLRAEYALGYGKTFADRYAVSASVARVQHPVLYSVDYTEARLDAAVRLTDKLFVTGQYAYVLTDKAGNDKYAALGLEYKGLFTDALTVGALGSYVSYDVSGRSEFNNAEVFATYSLTKNVEAFGTYSWGGKSVSEALHSVAEFRTSSLRDQGQVGVRVRF